MTESRATFRSRVPGILVGITLAMALLLSTAAEAAIEFRGATSVTVAGSGVVNISKPAGVVIGDVMIARIVTKGIPPITPPAGWTFVRRTENAAKMALVVYYKIADAGEPASYTWVASGGTNLGAGIQAYSGVDNTTPLDVENGQTTSGSLHATPSVTTTVANTMLVTTHAAKAANATWTPPGGMAERYEASDPNVAMEGSDVLQTAAGATGVKTATSSKASRDSATHILALKPAIAGEDLDLAVIKSVVTVRDPLGAASPAALAIPGAVVEYEISITNSGNSDATEVIVTDTLSANLTFLAGDFNGGAADVQIIVGAAPPVYCIAEVGGDTNADGCFLSATGDYLTVTVPVSATYPTGLTVGTTAPDNVAAVHFRVTVN